MVVQPEEMEAQRGTDQPEGKKLYSPPELTKYGALKEITLGVQCSSSFPACSPAIDPF